MLHFTILGGETVREEDRPGLPHELTVTVTNVAPTMWALPHPVEPWPADVEFATSTGAIVLRSHAAGVLPLALSPGATVPMTLAMAEAPPSERNYRVTITSPSVRVAIQGDSVPWK